MDSKRRQFFSRSFYCFSTILRFSVFFFSLADRQPLVLLIVTSRTSTSTFLLLLLLLLGRNFFLLGAGWTAHARWRGAWRGARWTT